MHEEKKRKLEIELARTAAEKEKDWAERDAILAGQQQLLEEYKTKVQTFPQELKTATKQAREEATKVTRQTAKVETDLFEKAAESNRKVYEAEIQALVEAINEQDEQVKDLSTDLGSAMKQIRVLTAQALESASSADKVMPKSLQREDA